VGQGPRHTRGDVDGVRVHRAGQPQPRRPSLRTVPAKPRGEDPAGPGSRADVRRRVVLRRSVVVPRFRGRRRSWNRVFARRVAVTALAVALVAAAEVAATLSATSVRRIRANNRDVVHTRVPPAPYGGEPHLVGAGSGIPSAVRAAALSFVRDYVSWSAGSLRTLPAGDASLRVIRLLRRQGPLVGIDADQASRPVHVARTGTGSFVVTSGAGNFLITRSRSRWVVVSMPGD
jgi:hypothetical protein